MSQEYKVVEHVEDFLSGLSPERRQMNLAVLKSWCDAQLGAETRVPTKVEMTIAEDVEKYVASCVEEDGDAFTSLSAEDQTLYKRHWSILNSVFEINDYIDTLEDDIRRINNKKLDVWGDTLLSAERYDQAEMCLHRLAAICLPIDCNTIAKLICDFNNNRTPTEVPALAQRTEDDLKEMTGGTDDYVAECIEKEDSFDSLLPEQQECFKRKRRISYVLRSINDYVNYLFMGAHHVFYLNDVYEDVHSVAVLERIERHALKIAAMCRQVDLDTMKDESVAFNSILDDE